MIKLYRTLDAVLAVRGEDAFALTGFSFDALFSSPEPDILVEEALRTAHPISLPELDQSFLSPLQSQEVWGAGLTYGGVERPELYFKASPSRVRGHGAQVGIRRDSTSSVPGPELVVALNAAGKIFGFTVGNNLVARDMAAESPLYLPQARMYRGSCALGPCLAVTSRLPDPAASVELTISRGAEVVFEGKTDPGQLPRPPAHLAEWLFREEDFPSGCLLMTGTGIVPPAGFTLQSGDVIRIALAGIGELVNAVA